MSYQSPQMRSHSARKLRIESLEDRHLLAVTVDTLVDEADGSITDGDVSLRDAIAVAPSGSTIDFHPTLNNALLGLIQGELTIAKSLTIDATGLPDGITITAQGNSRVILVDDATSADINVSLRGIRVTGGTATEGGAGIHSNERLTLSNATIFDNDGHGVYAEYNDLTIEESHVTGNQGVGVFSYGAPYINFANTVTDHSLNIRGTTIAGNEAEGVSSRFTHIITLEGSQVSENGGIGVSTNTITARAIDITPPTHSLSITNSEISGNADRGVRTLEGSVEIQSSIVSGNLGGGIENRGVTASATVSDSSVAGNTSQFVGGGIEASRLTLSGTTIRDNTSARGGGIYLTSASTTDRFLSTHGRATIIDSTIFDNHATDSGGGLTAGPVFLDVQNTTISGNTANVKGGGLHLLPASPTSAYPYALPAQKLSNSTITNNSALVSGSGISVTPPIVASAAVTLANTIVSGNAANTDGSPDIDRTGGFQVSASLVGIVTNSQVSNLGGNLFGADAKLGPLQDNGGFTLTHALLEGSAAIDSGDASLSPDLLFDQRGAPYARIFGPEIDMGALEQQPIIDSSTADFDRDGDVDGVDFLTWQRGAGTLIGASIIDGDTDQDGDVDAEDLATWESQYQASKQILFVESTTSLGAGLSNHDVDLAYLDDDEYLDAFVTTEAGPNQVWLNNGDGTFRVTNQALGVGNNIYAALGDIDNDGDVDAVVAVAGTEVALWLNDGTGSFTAGGSLPASSPLDLALGYLDDDDRLDLFVAQVAGPDLVFLNDPTDGFVDSEQQLGNASSKGVELADLNGDGSLDAFVAHTDGGQGAPNSIWFNDGDGNFSNSGQQIGDTTSQHVSLGDIDGDFDIDAVVANEGGNRIYRNNGAGVFTSDGQLLGDGGSSHVQLADLDLDGDLDIYVANWFDEPDRVWLNNGVGNFLSSQSLGMDTSSHVALGDIDNDGDIDAIVATFSNAQTNRIWLNQINDELANLAENLADGEIDTQAFDSALTFYWP